jgi:hypothetical protein
MECVQSEVCIIIIDEVIQLRIVQERGIRLSVTTSSGKDIPDPLLLSSLESHHPSGAKVTLDAENVLHWPVLFVYPEYGETDFIQSFDERST